MEGGDLSSVGFIDGGDFLCLFGGESHLINNVFVVSFRCLKREFIFGSLYKDFFFF